MSHHHRSVPADLREADLQVAAGPVPVRFPERQEGTGPVGLVEGQPEEQEQPAAKSGTIGHRGRRALQELR